MTALAPLWSPRHQWSVFTSFAVILKTWKNADIAPFFGAFKQEMKGEIEQGILPRHGSG